MTLQEEKPDPKLEPSAAEVSISFEARKALITLAGEIDLGTAAALDSAADEATLRALPVRLDLSAVTFMDSTGVGFVASLVRAGSLSGWRLTVVGPSQRTLETLTLSGLAPALDLVEAETGART